MTSNVVLETNPRFYSLEADLSLRPERVETKKNTAFASGENGSSQNAVILSQGNQSQVMSANEDVVALKAKVASLEAELRQYRTLKDVSPLLHDSFLEASNAFQTFTSRKKEGSKEIDDVNRIFELQYADVQACSNEIGKYKDPRPPKRRNGIIKNAGVMAYHLSVALQNRGKPKAPEAEVFAPMRYQLSRVQQQCLNNRETITTKIQATRQILANAETSRKEAIQALGKMIIHAEKLTKESLGTKIDPIKQTAAQNRGWPRHWCRLKNMRHIVSIWQRSQGMIFTATWVGIDDLVEGALGFCSGADLRRIEIVCKKFKTLLFVGNSVVEAQQNSNRLWYHILNQEIRGKPSNIPFFDTVNYKRIYTLFRVNYFRLKWSDLLERMTHSSIEDKNVKCKDESCTRQEREMFAEMIGDPSFANNMTVVNFLKTSCQLEMRVLRDGHGNEVA